jgi:ADP-ribose pyrophosphatase YjhB (NUDIX family)
LKVGAGALIEHEGRLLLLKRTQAPFKGCWNLSAGYVESDESRSRRGAERPARRPGCRLRQEGW